MGLTRTDRRRLFVAGCVAVTAISAAVVGAGTASAESGSGAVTVSLAAPDGVPANVVLAGKTSLVAAKQPSGTAATVKLSAAVGAYHVDAAAIQFNGVRYVAKSSSPEVVVRPGASSELKVTYTAEDGARDLHVNSLGGTGLQLGWASPGDGWVFALRRAVGSAAPRKVDDGTAVAISGTTAIDSGLAPGTRYSYSLFAKNHSRWYGPLIASVTTAPVTGSTDAAYVAGPSTLIAAAADVVSAAPTGDGVRLTLAANVATPLLGAGVVLPVLPGLEGGYLGVVAGVSSDGRTLQLVGGGLSDAFDYYELSVDAFTTDESLLPSSAVPAALAKGSADGGGTKNKNTLTGGAATQDNATPPTNRPAPPGAKAPKAATATSLAAKASCDTNSAQKVTFSPSIALGGHFSSKLDKYRFLGVDVPTGASLDMALTVKSVGAAEVETSGAYACELKLGKFAKTLTFNPVPLAVLFEPTVEVSVGGALKISDIGATVTGGVQIAGSMSLKNGPSFSGSTILNASPLTPKVTLNGGVGLKLGGALTVGPGVGTKNAGVIAGVKGELNPLDASLKAYFPVGSKDFNLCSELKAAFSAGLSLTAKAWLNDWSWSSPEITLDFLNHDRNYPGSPWTLPKGCTTSAGTPDSLLGPGVSKVSDSTTGSPSQWGHVEGFVPGVKTWVLSTGLVSDAAGSPGQFASSALGLPGDADLSGLAGYPTYDASSYQVTVIPSTSTLHVRYVFASEEYPEFVGSQYNDVMAVYVNGKNCAFVPGSSTPVAINTINAGTNSQHYVDNSAGAAGYSTTMDGLTKPLTCTVKVSPGVPVTVHIAVADTSDGVYDSAVALVDGGIWTD
jgi:hypothetical protein